MKWTKGKSLRLSRAAIWLFMLALAAVCVFAPGWLRWRLLTNGGRSIGKLPYYLISMYACVPFAAAVLWQLNRLLGNISAERVFTQDNVRCLRILSWCCIGAGGVLFVSGFYDFLFFALSAGAAFMGLILRVVKNVFAEAVVLKNENDFTI